MGVLQEPIDLQEESTFLYKCSYQTHVNPITIF